MDFVFFDVEVVIRLNDKNVFISFFPAFRRFIKHRVSNHSPMTLFIPFILFISVLAVFYLFVVKSAPAAALVYPEKDNMQIEAKIGWLFPIV